jgi:aspartyl aminopeptidase
MSNFKEAKQISSKFLEFVNKSVSPWHATLEIKTKLLNSGFKQLSEKERKILTLTFSLET